MDSRQSVQMAAQFDADHFPSPPVPTKNGHRRIPDDTHKSQGVTAVVGVLGLFPWRAKQEMTGVTGIEATAGSSRRFMMNPADHS